MFTADTENRGLVFDPRTKLAVMLTLVVFALGGAGSDTAAVRVGTVLLSVLPIVLLVTANQWKKAVVFGAVYAVLKAAELLLVPKLIMGAYMLSSTTVSEFIAAMHRMHIPQQITIPLSVMFRFFPTVLEEFAAINMAMKMRDIRIGGKNAGKFIEYRLVPLMVCSVNIGSELSAAALTRGLGVRVKRTNICKIGFHLQDLAVLFLSISIYVLWILGIMGVIK